LLKRHHSQSELAVSIIPAKIACGVVWCVRVIPIPAQVDITGFESPAAEHHQLGLNLDDLLVTHPSATFIGPAPGKHECGCS
tara:strand:+ start:375 stop:620 length:246 start_codon:yes stop_codon:yes gene_type:complete